VDGRRRRIDRNLLLASLAIAVGIVLIVFALARAETGSPEAAYPSAVEDVSPVPNAVQVLGQTQVIVDLAEGHEGRMEIDGVALDTIHLDELPTANVEPGAQIDVPPGVVFEPGNATLTFTPGEGSPIERFDEGRHTARVIFWRSDAGPDAARSYTWSFQSI
jgi:hypothetical protein